MPNTKSASFVEDILETKFDVKPTPTFRYLTTEALSIRNVWSSDWNPRDEVPPQTPNSEYEFDCQIHSLPHPFRKLDDLKIPYIREKGVSHCIDELGKYFSCKDYKFNLLQFWFLDIITDCLWRTQDDFKLPDDLQKIVLTWVLYFIDILRDPRQNLSRRKFFTVFKEAILIAAELVDEGCDRIPTPQEVFALIEEGKEQEESEISSSGSESTISSIEIASQDYDNISLIELEVDGERRIYELPNEECICDKYDASSVDTPTESDISSKHSENINTKSNKEEVMKLEDIEEGEEDDKSDHEEILEDIEFYQPDLDIPARFLPLPNEIDEEGGEEEQETMTQVVADDPVMCKMPTSEEEANLNKDQIEDKSRLLEVTDKFQVFFDSVSTTTTGSTSTNKSEQLGLSQINLQKNRSSTQRRERRSAQIRKILKDLAVHKMWEQRLQDMDNPRIGWVPTSREIEEHLEREPSVEDNESDNVGADDDDEWVDITLKRQKKKIKEEEDKATVNFGVLWAIIDFIFKYFYESFQFSLVKLAFQATPNIITQKVNGEWMVPKRIKQQFQRPKDEKSKAKKPKTPKPKKEKKDKGKKGKKDKKEAKKKEKKPKPQKPAKPSKEEKARLERERKEKQRLEQEMRRLKQLEEDQKRFIFPLRDAATDDFFMDIFDNWVKVEIKQKKGKSKKK